MVEGPLKIWPFPIANMFFKPEEEESEFNIKDHKIISGSPDYTGQFEITIDRNSTHWEIELVYGVTMTVNEFDKIGTLIYTNTVKLIEGARFAAGQGTIDKHSREGGRTEYIQDEPR